MIASLVTMVLDHREHHLENLRAGLTLLIAPLQYAADIPASVAHWSAETFATRSALQVQNAELRSKELKYQLQLQKMAAVEAENVRLRELLHASATVPEKVFIGELLAVDLDPFRRQVVLNRGSGSGIYQGQPLLDAYGVMGQVVHVSPVESTAVLITDPSHAVPTQINRNGLRALVLGTGEPDKLEVPHLPNNADVKEGDLLVTSGLGGRFPPGYPVAKVISVTRDPAEPYAEVVAKPMARLERSREVLLVLRKPEVSAPPTNNPQPLPGASNRPPAAPEKKR